jgi:hypothetical protein
MKMNRQIAIERCVAELLRDRNVFRATQYISPKETVKATRQFPLHKSYDSETYVITFGRPNYTERKFIKLCKQASEPFPITEPQLKFYPTKRKAA